MNQPIVFQRDTSAWIFFVWTAFAISVSLTFLGIWLLSATFWEKGFLAMGLFFTIASCLTLAKTVRDNHEAQRTLGRVVNPKADQILHEVERRTS